MTSLVTTLTANAIGTQSFSALSDRVGIVAIALLIVLLIQRELMRAFGGARSMAGLPTLDIVIAPLLVMFALTMTVRFLHLLQIG
jgi:hypothetical protein